MTDRTHNVSTKTKKLIGLGATSIKILGAPIILCWRSPGHSKSIHLHGGQKTIATYFQSEIKQLSHYNALCCDHVTVILIAQIDDKISKSKFPLFLWSTWRSLVNKHSKNLSSDLQRWHWVCSWREQAIATPPPPIFSLHDWYNCNLYFESMIINIKWACSSNI